MKKLTFLSALLIAGTIHADHWNLPRSKSVDKVQMPSTDRFKVPPSFGNSFGASYKSKIGFEKNKGQWPDQVEFKTDLGEGRRVFLEKNKFTYVVYNPDDLHNAHEKQHENSKAEIYIKLHAFEMEFVNANPSAELEGEDKNTFYYNYFLGNDPNHWASEVPVYNRLTYRNLYEGIDLQAYEKDGSFKYDYIVRAGAEAGKIRLQFNGADGLEVRNKNLYIKTSVGELMESIPYAYQIINGAEVKVACEYKLGRDGKTVMFYFPEGYDPAYELIIDPVLVASTYSGASSTTYGHCATYDQTGNIYTGGQNFGTGYPVTTGAFQTAFGGSAGTVDIAISKLNPSGSSLIYATYLGGSGSDYPHSLFVDTNNELFVYGSSGSTNYPTTTGCYDNTSNGLSDIVISHLNTAGTSLVGSTYIGGSGDDGINTSTVIAYNFGDKYRGEIVVNSSGNVFVASTTGSSNFPATSGAYDNTYNGGQDAVVFKMNNNLSSLTWASFLGGTNDDAGFSIRVSSTGDVYAAGVTEAGGFPTTTGVLASAFQGGSADGFLSRLNSSGSTLLSSTFIGSGALDLTYFLDIDLNNDIYVYGVTEGTFPVVGGNGVYVNPNSLNYLQKINSNLTTLIYSTMLGNGTKNKFSPTALMVDPCQNVYMSGWGQCGGYPVTPNAVQSTTLSSGFHLMVLATNASTVLFGSFFGNGGEHVDGGMSRFDPNGIIYQGVCECGPGFPTTGTAFAPNILSGASCDIAVFKIDFQVNCNPLLTNTIICAGQTATINIVNVNSLVNPTFSIQPGGQVSSSPSFTVSPLVTTIYTVFVSGVNGFSATVTNTGISTVSIAPSPQVSPTFTQATCSSTANAFNLGLTFNPSSAATPSYVVFWAPNIPFGVTTNTQTSSSGGIVPGVYNVTITAQYGCKTSTVFTITPIPTSVSFSVVGTNVITCATPVVTMNASPTIYSYTWLGLTGTYTGTSATFSLGQSGSWTVNAVDPSSGCGGTQTFAISQNTSVSTSTVSPLFQNITCSVTSVTTVTATCSTSVNISHYWISPIGGTLTTNNNPAIFLPGSPGTYTHIAINNVNGCFDMETFTVSSTSGFPTFSVVSPQNFTLGCGSKSVAIINIINAQTQPTAGGPVSYTILGPPSSTLYTPGSSSSYTVSAPGTWTAITKDNTNLCESKVQISVLQNTLAPDINVAVSSTVLSCFTPSVILNGGSATPNTSFVWSFPQVPGNLQSNTIAVLTNTAQPTNSVIANYTLTVTDNNNTCKTSSVVAMLQDLYPPTAAISGPVNISCITPTVVFTNQSSSNIPPAFPHPSAVVAYLWSGPTPQEDAQLVTTYTAAVPGVYTMIAQDMNNGCFAMATKTLDDFRVYPQLATGDANYILDCGQQAIDLTPPLVGPTTGFTYTWLTTGTVTNVHNKTLSVAQSGQYNVIITNSLSGCSSSAYLEVVKGNLNASFLSDVNTGYAPLAVNFTNTSTSSSTLSGNSGVTTYWNFGNGTSASSITTNALPPVVYTQAGTYTITMYAQKGECLDSAAMSIHVDIPSSLLVPNIFTPNGDGVNDLFFVKATNLDKIDFVVVDRWGNKVYELSSSTGNIEWDGKNQYGKESSAGIYFYTLTASGRDGTKYDKKGTITLIR